MSPYEEAMDAYSILMLEAKRRLFAIDMALEGKTGLPNGVICEFCFLELRVLCELIALGCLTAHGDLMTGKRRGTWQADKIVRDLEELHPDFYPIAATEGVFTKEELVKLWRKCGEVLHRGTFETLWSRLRYGMLLKRLELGRRRSKLCSAIMQSSWLMAAQLHCLV
jgi:hypothetical protein